jgi:5-(carboxyamino)imidazole ribonucleotide mutase
MIDKVFEEPIKKQFEFDESVATVFDDMLSRSVPFYQEVIDLIIYFASQNLENGNRVYDLGSSTGTTLLEIANRVDLNLDLIGIDSSIAMCKRAKDKANAYSVDIEFISIIMGSKSDYEIMKECAATLEKFDVKYEMIISSAHRSPQRTKQYIKDAEEKGAKAFICAAGMAAHLAGVVSSSTTKPVIGVPMKGGAMDGMDAMLSTVQMPAGMPVATVALGKAGAVNSAYLSMQILAITDSELAIKLQEDRVVKAKKVENDSSEIEVIL